MGRPRGGGSTTTYGLRRRSSASTVTNPLLYNTGVELMMECFEEGLSPSQLEAARKAKEEHKKALKQIEEAKAEAARASEAAVKAEAERQAAAKAEAERQAAEVAAAAAAKLAQQNNARNSGSSSPDIMIVGESPPLMGPPRPGQAGLPKPMSGPIVNTLTTRGVLPPHAAGMPQEMYRYPAPGQNNAQGSQWLFRPLRPGVPPQQNQVQGRPLAPPGAPRQPGTLAGPNTVTIVSGTSGLGIKRPINSPEEASTLSPASKRARGRFVANDTSNGSGGNWVPLDEYYYGKMEGDPTFLEEKSEFRFRCWICTKMLYNNVKAMMHLQGHIDSEKQQNLDLSDLTQCKHCYKQFDTPFEMQTHIEKVHLSNMNALMCRICEKDHDSRGALTTHMRQSHCACEMPYTCQLCHFRSSMYSDVVDHFKKKHDSSDSMLCLYCLRVFHVKFVSQGWGQTQVYYHHLLRHQSRTSNRKCSYCKLSFFNAQDMKNHRKAHHQPNQRGVIGLNQKQSKLDQVMIKVPEAGIMSSKQGGGPKSLNAPTISKVLEHRGLRFPASSAQSYCFECKMLMNIGDHYKKYIQCSMCRFATSCSFAYATHMMGFHSGQPEALSRSVPVEKALPAPLYCSCGFSSKFGNKIANHLVFCSKRTSSLNKPEIPPERPAQDETDPRHKPDASLLDVLGLVKKQVVNPCVEEEEARTKPDTKNIPDTDDNRPFTSLFQKSKIKTLPIEQDTDHNTTSTIKPEAFTSEPAPADNTSVFKPTPDISSVDDADITADTSALEDSSSSQNLLPSRQEEEEKKKPAEDVPEESEEAEKQAATSQDTASEAQEQREDDEDAALEDELLQAPETEDDVTPVAEASATPESGHVADVGEDVADVEENVAGLEAGEGEESKAEDRATTEEGESVTKDEASEAEDVAMVEEESAQKEEVSEVDNAAVSETEDLASKPAEEEAVPVPESEAVDSEVQEQMDTEEGEPSSISAVCPEEGSSENPPASIAQDDEMDVEEDSLGLGETSSKTQEQDGSAHPTEEAMDLQEPAAVADQDKEDSVQQAEDHHAAGDELLEDLNQDSRKDGDEVTAEEEELLGTGKEEEEAQLVEDTQPSGQDLDASMEAEEAESCPPESDVLPPESDVLPSESDALPPESDALPKEDEALAAPGEEAAALAESIEAPQDAASGEKELPPEEEEALLLEDSNEPSQEDMEAVPEKVDEAVQEAVSEKVDEAVQEQDEDVTLERSEAQTQGEQEKEEATAEQEPSPPAEEKEEVEEEEEENTNLPDNDDAKKDDDGEETKPDEDNSTHTESKPEDSGEERLPESTSEDKGNDKTSGDVSSSSSQPVPEDSADTEPSGGAGDEGSKAQWTGVDPPKGDDRTGHSEPSWQPTPQPGQPEERESERKEDMDTKEKKEDPKPLPAPPAPLAAETAAATTTYPDKGRGPQGSSQQQQQQPQRPYQGSSSSSSSSSDRDRQHHSRDYDHRDRDRDRSYDRNRGYSDHRDYRRDRDRDHYDRHHQYDRHRDQRNDNQRGGRYQQGGYGSQDRYYNQNRQGNRGGQNRHGYNDRNNYYRGYY